MEQEQVTNGAPDASAEEAAPTQEIIRRQPKPLSLRDPGQLAIAAAKSKFWKHITNPSQAVMIMAAGEELGLSPLAALQGITMIEGQLGFRANLIAQKIKQHEHYSYKVIERENDRCTLQFCEDGVPIDDEDEGKVTFTIKDARRMELVKPRSNWVKTPRAMCFWRCLTEGFRVYFPDLMAGMPIYSTDEIEEVIRVEAQDVEIVEQSTDMGDGLSPERVAHLIEGIEIVKPSLEEEGVGWLDGLNIHLGAIGADALEPGSEIEAGLAKLSDEQADELDAELQRLADQQAEAEDEG